MRAIVLTIIVLYVDVAEFIDWCLACGVKPQAGGSQEYGSMIDLGCCVYGGPAMSPARRIHSTRHAMMPSPRAEQPGAEQGGPRVTMPPAVSSKSAATSVAKP
jgi:hypothetical protein